MNPPPLELMLAELESSRLEVCLAPLNPRMRGWVDGGCKRVCLSRNCHWYRQFCSAHLSSRFRNHRKPDTRIKRANTIRALNQLIAGQPAGIYSGWLLSHARRMKGAA